MLQVGRHSRHAEETAFLWLLRDNAVSAPHYSLTDLAELDNRVEAHIDGLRIAGDEGWSCCVEGLQQAKGGEIFSAAVISLTGEDPRRIEQVCAAVEAATKAARGFVSALGWTASDKLRGKVAWVAGVEFSVVATRRHRRLRSASDRLRGTSVAGARGCGPDAAGPGPCAQQERWPDGICFASCEGRCARKFRPAASGLHGRQCCSATRETVCRRCNPALGRPRYLAPVAGESLSLITGVDIAYEDLEGDAPDDFEAGPSEQPEDEDVSIGSG